jgi:alanine-alpha-ketoisovalerate/valine-pyruvate aminotransferase
MTTIQTTKNRLISRILATKNEDLLVAMETIFANTQQFEIVSLSSEQIEMLLLSESDIASGNLISEEELDKLDSQWMK